MDVFNHRNQLVGDYAIYIDSFINVLEKIAHNELGLTPVQTPKEGLDNSNEGSKRQHPLDVGTLAGALAGYGLFNLLDPLLEEAE